MQTASSGQAQHIFIETALSTLIGRGRESWSQEMRFSRISLENWRNFGHVDVPLQTRAFLVGPNASGKSNLLESFRFLRDLVTPGSGFQRAVADRGGVSSIRKNRNS